MSLVKRIGFDTIARLKAAGELRFTEAEILRIRECLLGSIYLYGHSVECLISSAYLCLKGHKENEKISLEQRNDVLGRTRTRIDEIKKKELDLFQDLWPRNTKQTLAEHEKSHPIFGLALLIADSQREPNTVRPIKHHCAAIRRNWSPKLRYRDLKPAVKEIKRCLGLIEVVC